MRKQSKQVKATRKGRVRVDDGAMKTLRSLSNEEAFRFYEDVGKPTGETATSLQDFLQQVETVKLESLIFHLKRNDFKNWVEDTLKDSKLAMKLAKMPVTNDNRVRTQICSMVRERLKELEASSESLSIFVAEPAVITV
jgi:hypothetical protein